MYQINSVGSGELLQGDAPCTNLNRGLSARLAHGTSNRIGGIPGGLKRRMCTEYWARIPLILKEISKQPEKTKMQIIQKCQYLELEYEGINDSPR